MVNYEYMYKNLIQRIYDDIKESIDFLEEEEEKNGNISKENKEFTIHGLYQTLDICNNDIQKNEIENEKKINIKRDINKLVQEIEEKYIFNKNGEQ